jgi:hypothetical protein
MELNRRKLSLQFGGVKKHQSINIINKLMIATELKRKIILNSQID